jgi:hypothetical protein
MFRKRKKKYIEGLGSSSFKIQKQNDAFKKTLNSQDKSQSKRQEFSSNNNPFKLSFEKLLYEDTVLIQLENSLFDDSKKSLVDLRKEAKSFSQKPVTRFLNIIAILATLRFGYYLLNADFLKVNSIIYIFILFVPFIIGMPLIFFSVLTVWKKLFSPTARIIARVLFKYWYLVFALIYLKYTISIFDQIG